METIMYVLSYPLRYILNELSDVVDDFKKFIPDIVNEIDPPVEFCVETDDVSVELHQRVVDDDRSDDRSGSGQRESELLLKGEARAAQTEHTFKLVADFSHVNLLFCIPII